MFPIKIQQLSFFLLSFFNTDGRRVVLGTIVEYAALDDRVDLLTSCATTT